MNIRRLTPEQWSSSRFLLLRFALRHAERRITKSGWRCLVTAAPDTLAKPGTAVAIAYTACGQPAGLAYAQQYGEEACLVVVHPAFRGRGIGRLLLLQLAESGGRLTCNVAADHAASLSMCLAAGFVFAGIHKGPTGKPTHRLLWSRQDGAAEDFAAADSIGGEPLGTAASSRHIDALSQ